MPRHVVLYFMGRRRRHHRRRIPTASRYISGCTVNPSGPAVRRLHQGRSLEFRERSSPPSSPRNLYSCRVCVCVCVLSLSLLVAAVRTSRVVSLLRAPLPSQRPFEASPPPLQSSPSPVVRMPPWLLFLPEFFLLSTVRAPLLLTPSAAFARRLGRDGQLFWDQRNGIRAMCVSLDASTFLPTGEFARMPTTRRIEAPKHDGI